MFHKRGKIDLDSQQTRDQKKRDICAREGIDLILVPFDSDLFPYIKSELLKKGYLQNIDINSVSKSDYSSE